MNPLPRWAAFAATSLLLSGCFRYVPAEFSTVPPGNDVRVRVSREALARMPEGVAEQGPLYDGRLAAVEGDEVTVVVPYRGGSSVFSQAAGSQDIHLARADVVQFDRKEFDAGSTALLVGGALGVTALALKAFVFKGSGSQPGGPPDPNVIRLPVWSFPFR